LIKEFTIRYFKAFENVTARNLGRLNAFVGRNNAGKSTVLHALDFDNLIEQVRTFFPELEEIKSDRTEDLLATLEYKENGRMFDVLYAGMGLKRFLDILIKVTLSKASIVLLDEPEYGMHPELQRRCLTFFNDLAMKQDLQFFMATHSPVFLNASTDIEVFRVNNESGRRMIVQVPSEVRHTIFGDLGVRPSDLYQNDICLMVEGQDDDVFFEYVLHELYAQEFAGLAVGVVQYAGKAAAGITSGDLSVANVASAQPFVHWVRDRDAKPNDPPDPEAESFVKSLVAAGQSASLLKKREIEFYIPEEVYAEAQGGNSSKETAARNVCRGDQSQKLRKALGQAGCIIPRGSTLRSLLRHHLTKSNLDSEIERMIEDILVPWAKNIRGN